VSIGPNNWDDGELVCSLAGGLFWLRDYLQGYIKKSLNGTDANVYCLIAATTKTAPCHHEDQPPIGSRLIVACAKKGVGCGAENSVAGLLPHEHNQVV